MRLIVLSACFSAACLTTAPLPNPAGEPLPIAAGKFPHEVFDRVLTKHVDGDGLVDYSALRGDRGELEKYLVALSKTSPHQDPAAFPSKADQLAYWLNAYNATVLYAVTERPAMRSVHDEEKNFFYFTEYRFGDEKWTLYRLQNEVVRKEFSEPRIHFALNCAAAGCPELPAEAFFPEQLEEQLTRETAEFCASEKKVRVEGENVWVSQIFEWYADDFSADGGPIKFCKKWGRTSLPEDAEVKFIPWDWTLNDQGSPRNAR